jgi:hypothetical protein
MVSDRVLSPDPCVLFPVSKGENGAFVEESGKYSAYDIVAGSGPLAAFIGEKLTGVEAIMSPGGKVTGAVKRTTRDGTLRVDVEADELFLNEVVPPLATDTGR